MFTCMHAHVHAHVHAYIQLPGATMHPSIIPPSIPGEMKLMLCAPCYNATYPREECTQCHHCMICICLQCLWGIIPVHNCTPEYGDCLGFFGVCMQCCMCVLFVCMPDLAVPYSAVVVNISALLHAPPITNQHYCPAYIRGDVSFTCMSP